MGQLVEHDAEAVDVGRHRDRRPRNLLGARVGGGPEAQLRFAPRRRWGEIRGGAADAEVEELRDACRGDQHVARLQVAVHHQVAVGEAHRLAHPEEEVEALVHAHPPGVAERVERDPLHVLHHHERDPDRGGSAVEELRDVRVAEPGEDLTLDAEAAKLLAGAGRRGRA